MHRTLSRRTVLKGLLGATVVSLSLPTLEIFTNTHGTAYAGGSSFPKRFGIWFWGNGAVHPTQWVPDGDGPTWQPSPLLSPLSDVKENITVVSGTDVKTLNEVPHGSGPAGLLTGDAMRNNTVTRPTVDQVIAESVGAETRFRSLELGVQRSTQCWSYNGPNQSNPPECSPAALFSRLFTDGFRLPGESSTPDPRLALRRSVLDAVGAQSNRLRDRLGAADRMRLDEHLEGVRSLEQRIQRLESDPPNLAACARPSAPMDDYPDRDGRPQLTEISRVMSDLVAMALACDLTRVFFFAYSQPVNNLLFANAPSGHHQLTHDEPGDQPQVAAITRLILHDFAYFVSALRTVREGAGTLLDHCAVVGTTDTSYAKAHLLENYPILIAGGCNGALRQGIHYKSHGENSSRVMLTLMQAMDVRVTDFGVGPGRVTDPITGILS